MKLILTGATGFIGHEVLTQCLSHPSVTSILVLSRRELPASIADNPKLKVAIVDDFLSFPESTRHDFKDADACIWALGKARMPDDETARKVSIDYTMAAAKAFSENIPSSNEMKTKFRFIYVSGALAERDQTKRLWFSQTYRRIRGEVENQLLAHAKDNQDTFESYIMRPGLVLGKEGSVMDIVGSVAPSVRVDALAKVMLDLVLNGSKDQIFENAVINQLGN